MKQPNQLNNEPTLHNLTLVPSMKTTKRQRHIETSPEKAALEALTMKINITAKIEKTKPYKYWIPTC